MTPREKQLTIALLTERVERLSGKKVVLESKTSDSKDYKILQDDENALRVELSNIDAAKKVHYKWFGSDYNKWPLTGTMFGINRNFEGGYTLELIDLRGEAMEAGEEYGLPTMGGKMQVAIFKKGGIERVYDCKDKELSTSKWNKVASFL